MKVAPVLKALSAVGARQVLVHTGQHYDVNMSDIFFQQLGIPHPDYNLEVGSGSHAQQTAQIMTRFEPVVQEERPACVLVYGDVNSTVAAVLDCAKLMIPTAHIEAGLRSFDRTMPEEINRLVTDQLADLLFTPSPDGNEHLLREGVRPEAIHLVGNVMIDTLITMLPYLEQHPQKPDGPYALVTLHRPSNVDDPVMLQAIVKALGKIAERLTVIFPVHPRTRKRMEDRGITPGETSNIQVMAPVGYLEFLALQKDARLVVTDSGGIQEETTYLRVPCLTLRENTERPITVTVGSNTLIGQDTNRLIEEVDRVLSSAVVKGSIPELWDGKAAQRIAQILMKTYA
jgi:UDP-N-acetylglucosamine 2-epimerase (non-hydrolysing)